MSMAASEKTLELKLVSLKDVPFHDYVDSVTLPTKAGEITVLPGHVALISALGKGTIRARLGGDEEAFPVGSGFLEVDTHSRLTILLNF